jgi:serine protease
VNVTQQTVCNHGKNKCEQFPAWSGTSMASPHVAGAAALAMSLGVTEPVAVERALRDSARRVDDSDAGRKKFGAGILSAANAASAITRSHVLVRLGALLAVMLVLSRALAKKDRAASPWRLAFILPALAAGPGLFFFAPWLLPRADVVVDVLARPLADLDFFVGASLHRWLPLANALVPFGLTALLLGVKRLRPAVGGVAAGTAAYLVSVAVLGEHAGPFGRTLLVAWCALNAALCVWIARANLEES